MKNILEEISNDVKFTQRASPVPFGARTGYRIAQICLILDICCEHRGSSSLKKIQVIANGLLKKSEMQHIIQFSKKPSLYLNFTPRIDPCVNRAIEFARRYGLINQNKTNQRYKLTVEGKKYAYKIQQEEIMQSEISLLKELGINLDEALIDSLGC